MTHCDIHRDERLVLVLVSREHPVEYRACLQCQREGRSGEFLLVVDQRQSQQRRLW